ncbi:MAG TPA: hypothetical protein VIF82_09865 [Burkholderiaceae bacterium]
MNLPIPQNLMVTKPCIAALICLAVAALFQSSAAQASEAPENKVDEPKSIQFKLTPSYYSASDGNDATDINLRGNFGQHTAWIGVYNDKNGYRQERTGYEYRLDFELIRWVLSAQSASGGFVGGSASAEIGGDTFGILGFGRTNLREYYNLNFDPNDAITVGIGSRAISKTELSLFQVRDDRLSTQQRVTHFVWRYKPSYPQRVTVDASYKSGLASDNIFIRGYGLSATYDCNPYFVRIARDQYANFTETNLIRLSIGMRF